MENSKTKTIIRNSFFGVVGSIATIIFPLIANKIFVMVLGESYLGLNSFFHSIIGVLGLVDIGFGSAIAFSLYEPLSKKETQNVNALLKLYRNIYRAIGIIIFLVGLFIVPILNKLIKSGIPSDINIYIVYFIYLLEASINYIFFAQWELLLIATERSDVKSKIYLITQTISYFFRISFLYLFKNYYLYIIVLPITAIVDKTITMIVTKKMNPQYKCEGKIENSKKKLIKDNISAIAIGKFGNSLSNSLDNVFVSSSLGLSSVAIYSNYYYIVSSLLSITQNIVFSGKATIGLSIAKDDTETNYKNFNLISTANHFLSCLCSICLLCSCQVFMEWWMGENLLASNVLVIEMFVYNFICQERSTIMSMKDVSGLWKKDKYRPLISGIVKVLINLVLINKLGILSPLFSSIIVISLIDFLWESKVIFKFYFKKDCLPYWKEILEHFIVTIIFCYVCNCLCSRILIDGLIGFFVRGVICVIVIIPLFLIVYSRKEETKTLIRIIKIYVKSLKNKKEL